MKNSLMPSASDCSQPLGPARLGPQRLPRRATTLRSNMTMKRTETIEQGEDDDELHQDDDPDDQVDPFGEDGVPV